MTLSVTPARASVRIVIIFLLILIVAIAALAGYFFGVRRRPAPTLFPPPPPASPASAESPPAPAAGAENHGDEFGAEKARLIRSRDSEAAALRAQLTVHDAVSRRLAEFSRERERLFRDLADARGGAARYRQLVIDIETNAPPPILAGVGEPDDLKLIVGVGPVLERMLHNLGVTTFRQIARWSERDVADFDAKLPEFPGRIQRDQWVTQARALHESKFGQGLLDPRARG